MIVVIIILVIVVVCISSIVGFIGMGGIYAYNKKSAIDGDWSEWKSGICSKECGEGEETQTRKCDNPKPENSGKECSGDSTKKITCNTKACPTADEIKEKLKQEQEVQKKVVEDKIINNKKITEAEEIIVGIKKADVTKTGLDIKFGLMEDARKLYEKIKKDPTNSSFTKTEYEASDDYGKKIILYYNEFDNETTRLKDGKLIKDKDLKSRQQESIDMRKKAQDIIRDVQVLELVGPDKLEDVSLPAQGKLLNYMCKPGYYVSEIYGEHMPWLNQIGIKCLPYGTTTNPMTTTKLPIKTTTTNPMTTTKPPIKTTTKPPIKTTTKPPIKTTTKPPIKTTTKPPIKTTTKPPKRNIEKFMMEHLENVHNTIGDYETPIDRTRTNVELNKSIGATGGSAGNPISSQPFSLKRSSGFDGITVYKDTGGLIGFRVKKSTLYDDVQKEDDKNYWNIGTSEDPKRQDQAHKSEQMCEKGKIIGFRVSTGGGKWDILNKIQVICDKIDKKKSLDGEDIEFKGQVVFGALLPGQTYKDYTTIRDNNIKYSKDSSTNDMAMRTQQQVDAVNADTKERENCIKAGDFVYIENFSLNTRPQYSDEFYRLYMYTQKTSGNKYQIAWHNHRLGSELKWQIRMFDMNFKEVYGCADKYNYIMFVNGYDNADGGYGLTHDNVNGNEELYGSKLPGESSRNSENLKPFLFLLDAPGRYLKIGDQVKLKSVRVNSYVGAGGFISDGKFGGFITPTENYTHMRLASA
jgi:hypothetical protein